MICVSLDLLKAAVMSRQVVRERPAVDDSEALLPLIEQELDSLSHALARPSARQTSGLSSVSSRAQESFAAAMAPPLRRERCA